uniref:Mediator of RNA polymerase II transcription subunit 23 n=1 Tax=Heterorhabditis bacteriophora TaxID=37862 RepID=A0A1I7W8D3_HETBA
MQQLCRLHAELTGDMDPPKAYRRNIERLSYNGVCYGLGQLSALSLWTLTGVLSTESSRKSPFLETPLSRLSLSDFLLKSTSELDTASLVRALFENYSHWFSRGLDFLPLPLLSATVRSVPLSVTIIRCILEFSIALIHLGYLMDHPDIGYVIYALLKSVTVVGLESVDRSISEMDLAKQILTWVCTTVIQYESCLAQFTISIYAVINLNKTVDYTIFKNRIPASLEYANLLWSISFRVMEEPLQVSFKNSLIQKLCDAFVIMNFSHPLLSTVTSGIESLIIHTMNFTLVFALRILIVCVFREDSDSRKDSAINFEPFLNEIYNIYRKCELRDASMITSFCERLRESQRLSILSEFSQVVLSNVKSVSVSSRDTRAVGTCLLVSTSTIGDVAYRKNWPNIIY